MSALPKSIRRQLEEAEALQAQLNAPAPAPAEPETPPSEEPPVEPAPAPKPKAGDEDPNSPTWQQRYRTLQGEFNAKVPQLQAALKEQTRKNEELEARLTSLEQAKPVERLTTAKDEEEFGADMLDLIDRKAREIFQVREQELLSEIRQLRSTVQNAEGTLNQVAETQIATAQDRMVAKLTELVPNWEEVNNDEGFLNWLGEADPVSGIVRQELLNAAHGKMDAVRIANIFKAYTGAQPQAPRVDTLQSQVAPTRNANAAPSQPVQPDEFITPQQIEKFYDDAYRRNLFSNEERARREAEINLAIAQNRVRA